MLDKSQYKLLFNVDSPSDIRNMKISELKLLCSEIREYMIEIISQTGGHFGGGLGAVELTVALHKVYNTPNDKLVWDVGHQAYPHKIITGRRDKLNTIRQLNGLSGFLKRTESQYDAFGAGHASTSISAALGIAEAIKQKKENKKVVAIIGDGSMTGGMAYEALNNSGVLKSNLTVVLNDNNMSIAENVWQFSNYFSDALARPSYNKVKGAIWELTGKLDNFGDRIRKVASRLESGIKSIITPGMLFEALGFKYFGPFNGHNIQQLIKIFEKVKLINGPVLVHVLTEKGKGYKPAEGDSQKLHGTTPFDKITGKALKKPSTIPSFTSVFGKAITQIVEKDKSVIGITAAMPSGTGLDILQKDFPENFYDVGIAEEHAVTFAAGMATEGIIPVVSIYSTFLQRTYDQIIHDIALQNLHVIFAIDRAGLVGADGPTHHGSFDLSYLRTIPGMTILAPRNEIELRNMLFTAIYHCDGLVAIRYPRGSAIGLKIENGFTHINIGEYEILNNGSDLLVLSVGTMSNHATSAIAELSKENINPMIVDVRTIKPLNENKILDLLSKFEKVVTVEENSIVGGFGSSIAEMISENNLNCELLKIGLPDNFVEHGTQKELYRLLKIDAEGIACQIKDFFKN